MKFNALFVVFLGVILVLLVSCSTQENFNGSFYSSPVKIHPGEELTIKYNPDSSNLAGKDKIKAIAYLYNNKLENTIDVPLVKEGKIYSGKVVTDDSTLVLMGKRLQAA